MLVVVHRTCRFSCAGGIRDNTRLVVTLDFIHPLDF